MTEAKIVQKIKLLKQIEPRKDWVILTRKQIFGEEDLGKRSLSFEVFPRLFFLWKPALATLAILLVLFGNFSFVQSSLPGDLLYPLKKITEKSQVVFVSEINKPRVQLELANKRLEELARIAQTNQTQKLAPAINEFQASTVEAAKNLSKIVKSDKKADNIVKEVVLQTQKLEEKKKKIEALGVVVGESSELESAMKELVEREIREFENRTLSENQEKILEEIKTDFETGNYSEALTKILNINQSN